MAFVYWIKSKTDTDITQQGYVGITSKNVPERISSHIRSSYKINKLLGSLLKSGEFEVLTICECSIEYAGFIENKLRPHEFIGLNRSKGGNTARMTSEGKKAVSIALSGKPKSEETRRKLSESRTGKKSVTGN